MASILGFLLSDSIAPSFLHTTWKNSAHFRRCSAYGQKSRSLNFMPHQDPPKKNIVDFHSISLIKSWISESIPFQTKQCHLDVSFGCHFSTIPILTFLMIIFAYLGMVQNPGALLLFPQSNQGYWMSIRCIPQNLWTILGFDQCPFQETIRKQITWFQPEFRHFRLCTQHTDTSHDFGDILRFLDGIVKNNGVRLRTRLRLPVSST